MAPGERRVDQGAAPAAASFDGLRHERYVSVTSWRRDGRPVATPLWFVVLDGRAYARTATASAKVARIRRNPDVLLAPCRRDGEETGPRLAAAGRALPEPAAAPARRALTRKYGLAFRVYEFFWATLRRRPTVVLEFAPAPGLAAPPSARIGPDASATSGEGEA